MTERLTDPLKIERRGAWEAIYAAGCDELHSMHINTVEMHQAMGVPCHRPRLGHQEESFGYVPGWAVALWFVVARAIRAVGAQSAALRPFQHWMRWLAADVERRRAFWTVCRLATDCAEVIAFLQDRHPLRPRRGPGGA